MGQVGCDSGSDYRIWKKGPTRGHTQEGGKQEATTFNLELKNACCVSIILVSECHLLSKYGTQSSAAETSRYPQLCLPVGTAQSCRKIVVCLIATFKSSVRAST